MQLAVKLAFAVSMPVPVQWQARKTKAAFVVQPKKVSSSATGELPYPLFVLNSHSIACQLMMS